MNKSVSAMDFFPSPFLYATKSVVSDGKTGSSMGIQSFCGGGKKKKSINSTQKKARLKETEKYFPK